MVDPNRWGPAVWDAIHFVAAGYPVTPTDADVRAYGAFFRGLAGVLPCAPCRKHFAENIERLPPDAALAAGRAETFAWTVAFHNVVNESLHKPPLTLVYDWPPHFRLFVGGRKQSLYGMVVAAEVSQCKAAGCTTCRCSTSSSSSQRWFVQGALSALGLDCEQRLSHAASCTQWPQPT